MWVRPRSLAGIVAVALAPAFLAPPPTRAEESHTEAVEQGGASETPAASVPHRQRRRMRYHGP